MTEQGTLRLAGLLTSVEKKFSKKDGSPFGILTLEDDSGTLEFMAWGESFSKNELILKPGAVISCNARISIRDEEIKAMGSDFKALTPKPSKKPLRLRIERRRLQEEDLPAIMTAIKRFPGKRMLVLEIVTESGTTFPLQLGSDFTIAKEEELRVALESWLMRG
jgi:DNA polymerase-3 subunit alpha